MKRPLAAEDIPGLESEQGFEVEKPPAAFPICFHQGQFVPWSRATLHANSLAMRYALSVFEGIRLYRQHQGSGVVPFRLGAHLARLRQSLELMRFPEPQNVDIAEVISELVRRSSIAEDTYIRVSVSAGNPGGIATAVESWLTVTASRMGRKPWLAEKRAMRVAISPWQRAPELSFPAAAKNISSYAGPRLALLQARASGYDNVVLTTHDGFLCEAPTAALFVIKDGVVLSPPLTDGVLPSITRATVFEICEALGIDARERRISRTDAYTADEAFLCGTGLEFGPLAEFDGHPLETKTREPLTPRIIDAYFRLVRGQPLAEPPGQRSQAVSLGADR